MSGAAYVEVQLVHKSSIYTYTSSKNVAFLKISTSSPTALNAIKKLMDNGFGFSRFPSRSYPTFESNLSIVLRFMVDAKLTGMNWIELPAGRYKLRADHEKVSECQYEVDIVYLIFIVAVLILDRMNDLISHSPEGDWSHIAPLRLLSFDIECAGRKGAFPEASVDPVIQIAAVVKIHGEKNPIFRTIFCYRSCAAIVGADVFWFDREEDMLMAFLRFLQTVRIIIIFKCYF